MPEDRGPSLLAERIKTMLKRSLIALALVLGLCAARAAAEGTLLVGDPAPKLEVKEFIKGDEVKKFEKGKVYVVECWATWCGECRESIPHLADLHKKYKEVTFIGVSVLENDQKAVRPFVKEMGDKMDYRVALDAVPEGGIREDGKMVRNWILAAKRYSVPTAFLINGEGKVAWVGHPKDLDDPLKQVAAGK
jgi:thiol-disulfide isomerase/thioredoxin